MDDSLAEAKNQFVASWGEMGSHWGVNKTMARIHAHLMISEAPVSTDELMKELGISRGNANMNIRALIDWGLAQRVTVKGERREFFKSEKDVWRMCCRIARERKRRELEPVIGALEGCLRLAGKGRESVLFRERLGQLLELVRSLDFALGKIAQQEKNAVLPRLLKLLG